MVVALVVKNACCFFQAEDGIRDLVRSRGLGDVYKRQDLHRAQQRLAGWRTALSGNGGPSAQGVLAGIREHLSLIHI